MEYYEKPLASKEIFKGKIVTLRVDDVELSDGGHSKREVVHHGGGVTVLALDAQDNVLFVRQFRYPYGETLLELPAGKLESGENPALCGRRELEEETGHVAGRFESLGQIYPTPGYVDEVIYLYLATDLTATSQRLDDGEFLTVEKMPFREAVELCLNGTLTDAKTIVALLKHNEQRRAHL